MADDGILDKVIAAGLWAAGLSWLVPVVGTMTVLNRFVPADRTEPLTRFYGRVQLALAGVRWRAVVHPAVRQDTQYLFVQNHVNHFDYATAYCATPHYKTAIELEDHFRYPFYGWFMKGRGAIPIRRGGAGQTAELARRLRAEAAKGHSIGGFPEGTRTLDGSLGPFKSGLFFAARDAGLAIVPVAVVGMYDVMRKGSWVIHPGCVVTVYCEEPVPTAGVADSEIPALAARVRSAIRRRLESPTPLGQGMGD